MNKEQLILIGNGMAGIRTLEELLSVAPDRYNITVFGAEPHGNYNRIMLSPVLAGETQFADIITHPLSWYSQRGITLHTGNPVIAIDRAARQVAARDGTLAHYDKLVIATGSQSIILPVPGKDLPGVVAYRDIADTQAMLEASAKGGRAVVIGGGLLGLEAAYGLKKRGMEVSVVHLMPWLMERQLDKTAADLLQSSLMARGIDFYMEYQTSELVAGEHGRVAAIRFHNGEQLPADLVVMAAGIRPQFALAEAAGLHCQRGIVVDDYLLTSDPNIWAVGECANHNGVAYGLVAPLFEQAKVLGRQLAGLGKLGGAYKGSLTSTKLKVTGIDLFSAGDFMGGEGCDEIVLSDPAAGCYKKLVIKNDQLVGTVLYGDSEDAAWYFQLLRTGQPLAELRPTLMFGQAASAPQGNKGNNVADLPDDMQICGCNGVSKGTIVKAIREQGLTTLEAIKKNVKAASSCGTCADKVEAILQAELGSSYQAASNQAKPICACSDHTHASVRKAIREHKLTSLPAVMQTLNWKTPDGCDKCRPALNYYLISTWPDEARDDPQARFVNERVHGNIQKDGTFSVVPRMWGGLTTANELRAIADAAEKYKVQTIKVTGGQRIDLLGIKKEDLPAIWADLNQAGMVSGHAYGKSLRTVKTCVGAEHCRFGTQYAMDMGVKLEKMLFGMWSPAKVKLAVSGCPRNCAEMAIKDVGVLGIENGYEIHIAGNGGTKTVVAQFLCKVANDDEVMEVTGAFLQLYREEAWYLERTVHYVERVGIEHIKALVVDDKNSRLALYHRLLHALKDSPDPWAEIKSGERQQEFLPLTMKNEEVIA